MKTLMLLICAFGFLNSTWGQSDIRVISGRSVDVGPVQTWLANRKGERPLPHWKQITVLLHVGSVASWQKCYANIERGPAASVLVANLPANIRNHLAEVARLENQVRQARAQVEGYARQAKLADATAPTAAAGSAAYVANAMAERDRANLMMVNAETLKDRLAQMEDDLRLKARVEMKVLAMKTGTYNGMDVWDCGVKR